MSLYRVLINSRQCQGRLSAIFIFRHYEKRSLADHYISFFPVGM